MPMSVTAAASPRLSVNNDWMLLTQYGIPDSSMFHVLLLGARDQMAPRSVACKGGSKNKILPFLFTAIDETVVVSIPKNSHVLPLSEEI